MLLAAQNGKSVQTDLRQSLNPGKSNERKRQQTTPFPGGGLAVLVINGLCNDSQRPFQSEEQGLSEPDETPASVYGVCSRHWRSVLFSYARHAGNQQCSGRHGAPDAAGIFLCAMVFCADCGRPMEFERLPHGAEESKKVCYYICKARQADDKCIGHQITEKLLKALLMDQLHLFITQLSDRRKVVEELRKIEDVQNPVYRAKGEIMSLTDKVSQMAKKREQLYADYVAGVVDSEDYQLIREDYSRQYDGLRAALQEAENKKVQVEQQIEEYLNMTSHLEEHLDNFEFDIQLVKSLVQKIEVSADKRIRIVFGFRDVFTELGKESAET